MCVYLLGLPSCKCVSIRCLQVPFVYILYVLNVPLSRSIDTCHCKLSSALMWSSSALADVRIRRRFGARVTHGTEWLVEPLEPEIMNEARYVALRGSESSEAASQVASRKPHGLRQTQAHPRF